MNPDSRSISHTEAPALSPVLVRISEAFAGIVDEVLRVFGAESCKPLSSEYYLIRTATPAAVRQSREGIFARWNLPLDHAWPCNPSKMEGFIDKAANTLLQKFGARKPQAVFIGLLNPGSPDRYFRNLAANLRDRVLRVFPSLLVQNVEEQNPEADTLFCLVGKEGLYCGMASPRASNGFYPGGSKFIGTHTPDTISRAGAKIAEALHYLGLHRPPLPTGSRWLELGACPGGMTSELLNRHFRVTAIDVAALDKRLDGHPGLTFIRQNVAEFHPTDQVSYDALLCDMNGPPADSIRQVVRLSRCLAHGGIVVFTLKLPRVESVAAPLHLLDATVATATAGGLRLFARTHLTYNRHEFTLFFERGT